MFSRVKKVLFSFLLTLSYCFCYGQDGVASTQHTIDSLDRIQPEAFVRIKPQGSVFILEVRSQKEFERLNEALAQAIEAGETNIRVKISKGIYRFKENQISLKGIRKDVAISIVGKKAVLTSCPDLKDADNNPWQEMIQMDDIIQVLDKDKKLCRIPYSNQWNSETRNSMTRVQVTQWFRAPVYDVERIDDKGIYFIANDLQWEDGYAYKGYNVNFDYLYAGKHPRIRLYDKRKAVTAISSCFLRMENTEGVSFEMSGFIVKGNKSGAPLIAMSNVKSQQVYIHDCTFERIHYNVGDFSNVSNVTFSRNKVRYTDGNELRFVSNCENVRVTNNTFEQSGQSIGNTFCVTCWESSYYIANNTFSDFSYGAIGVGVWHGFEKKYYSGGIIEYNEIFYKPAYLAKCMKHTLMDSGSIYFWTRNDGVIIRNNYIHDYSGAGDNRGIFCDDGANNLKIYKNIILNIPNSYCIDSRYVYDKDNKFNCNSNNLMAYNIVDNGIRFQGYDGEERHCGKGRNYVLKMTEQEFNPKMVYERLEMNEEDSIVSQKWVKARIKTIKNKIINK